MGDTITYFIEPLNKHNINNYRNIVTALARHADDLSDQLDGHIALAKMLRSHVSFEKMEEGGEFDDNIALGIAESVRVQAEYQLTIEEIRKLSI